MNFLGGTPQNTSFGGAPAAASVTTPTVNSVQPRRRAEEAGDVERRDSGGEDSIVPAVVPDLPAAEIEPQEDEAAPTQDNG